MDPTEVNLVILLYVIYIFLQLKSNIWSSI